MIGPEMLPYHLLSSNKLVRVCVCVCVRRYVPQSCRNSLSIYEWMHVYKVCDKNAMHVRYNLMIFN